MDYTPSAADEGIGNLTSTLSRLDLRVADHSQNNTNVVESGGVMNNHFGAVVNFNAHKKELPPLPRCPAPSPYYVHRKHLENHMASYFFNRQGLKRYVLYGLGGSGKTEAGLKFVDRYCYFAAPGEQRFSHAFWVDATNVMTIDESLKDIARSLGLSSAEDTLRWLATRKGEDANWIMFYNNADEPTLELAKHFPKCSHGSILITTRNHNATQYALGPESDYHASELEEDEACELLLKRARISRPSPSVLTTVTTLVRELDRFPLSVSQASAYMYQTLCTPKEYLELLRSHREDILRDQDAISSLDGYQYGSVQATLRLSYSRLSPAAQHLLHLFAFLHFDGIQEEIFRNMCLGLGAYASLDQRLRIEGEDEAIKWLREFREAIVTDDRWDMRKYRSLVGVLRSFSLASLSVEDATCSVHPIVQEWTRGISRAFGSANKSGSGVAAILLASSTIINPQETTEELAFFRGLAPHVDQVLKHSASVFNICEFEFGNVFRHAGRYNDMACVAEECMNVRKRVLGPIHSFTLASITQLGVAYNEQGHYNKTISLLFPALEILRAQLGSQHTDSLGLMNVLGNAYDGLGRHDKAAELHSQTWESHKGQLGLGHPDTLRSMGNLGSAYYGQGWYDKAAELFSQVLEIFQARLGPDHPSTLSSMHNLGFAYYGLGWYDKAVELHSQALMIRKSKLPPNHPDTLRSAKDLEQALQAQRQAPVHQHSHSHSPSPWPLVNNSRPDSSPYSPPSLHMARPLHSIQSPRPDQAPTASQSSNLSPPPRTFPVSRIPPPLHQPWHTTSPSHPFGASHPFQTSDAYQSTTNSAHRSPLLNPSAASSSFQFLNPYQPQSIPPPNVFRSSIPHLPNQFSPQDTLAFSSSQGLPPSNTDASRPVFAQSSGYYPPPTFSPPGSQNLGPGYGNIAYGWTPGPY